MLSYFNQINTKLLIFKPEKNHVDFCVINVLIPDSTIVLQAEEIISLASKPEFHCV